MSYIPSHSKRIPLRLSVLGEFRLESARHPLTLPTRKMESLLAYVALHPEPIAREKLCTLIWCDAPKDQARNSLRNSLAALRKRLGNDILIVDRETIQIAPQVWVDARQFKAQADAFLAAPSPRLDGLDLGLYQGDLLSDLYEDWILPEREHYRTLYIEVLLKLAQCARAQSEHARAIEYAQSVLRNDPANEQAHQHLMFAYLVSGHRQAALEQYERCRRALQNELDVEPLPETTALYEWIKQAASPYQPLQARLTNLPIPISTFIGRQRETAQLKATLVKHRLVTLTGAGGSGKTRLAIQVATDLLDQFRDGVWWIDLGPVMDSALVVPVIAKALGIRETVNEPLSDTLAYWIGTRQMLLVLDNCEHLITACASLAEKLLQTCPRLVILATSREGLGVYGEVTYLVPPLAAPLSDPAPHSLEEYEAIRLFMQRAQEAARDFALSEKNGPAIAQICRRLDGIPLAIELAAARIPALSVEEIAAHLDDRLTWLAASRPPAAPRQQTLRALIDWSHDLLAPEEKVLFRRLAVFREGASLPAVEQVCSGEGIQAEQILDLLTRLIDKSLLSAQEQNGQVVYRMLETLRDYADEKLQTAGETARLRDRHLAHFLAFAEAAEPKLHGAEQLFWSDRVEQDHNNLRAALEWSDCRAGGEGDDTTIRLASSLFGFWSLRGYWSEGRAWLTLALKDNATTPARAKALLGLAELTVRQDGAAAAEPLYAASLALFRKLGDKWGTALASSYSLLVEGEPARAKALFDESLALAQDLGDEWLTANAYHRMGINTFRQGNMRAAAQIMEQGLVHARQAGDKWLTASSLVNLGEARRGQMDYVHAASLYEEGLAIERELGDRGDSAIILHNMAYIALEQREYARAEAFFRESMKLHQEGGSRRGVAECLIGMGTIASVCQEYVRAACLWASGERLFEAMQQKMEPTDRATYDRNVAALRARTDDIAFHAAWQAGQSLTLEQAIDLAMQDGA